MAEIAKRLHATGRKRARDPMRITIRSITVHRRATLLPPRPHRSLWWSSPRHRRRLTNIGTSRQGKTVPAKDVRLPPDIRNQVMDLLADALVQDYRAYPT